MTPAGDDDAGAAKIEEPRSIADYPDPPLGKERTSRSTWAAANEATFGGEVQ
jgi:hypothetical protein